MIRLLSALFFLICFLAVFAQDDIQKPLWGFDYDRCEGHKFGGWKTISVQFTEAGDVEILSDDYVIKPQFDNQEAFESELQRISNAEASVMAKLDARVQMYVNTQKSTLGNFILEDGLVKVELDNDEIFSKEYLTCEVEGRYLKCSDLNFVLVYDEVIFDYDVIRITNVAHHELTFQEEFIDRWIVHIDTESLDAILDNGENFQLESMYNRGQFLAHGRDGKFGLFSIDEMGINYDFRFYDPNGEGPVEALEDLKFKPSYFFGDYNYIVGIDQEMDNVRISKKYAAEENLWYVESAMCDVIDELVREQ